MAASGIFISCVYLGSQRIPPFVTFDFLATLRGRLEVTCHVSCDPNSETLTPPFDTSYSLLLQSAAFDGWFIVSCYLR